MREIKFRAWDTENKEWVSTSSVGWNYVFERSETSHKNGQQIYVLDNGYAPEIIVNQYTGLKDKNGVEIYEGDIVTDGGGFCKYEVTYIVNEKIGVNSEYDYLFTGFIFREIRGKKGELDTFEHLFQNNRSEVIGNIYENKELLTN